MSNEATAVDVATEYKMGRMGFIFWRFCQLFLMPMTVYAAACWNKYSFESIHSHSSVFIANFLQALYVPFDIGFSIGKLLTFIPAFLANFMPSGSELMLIPAFVLNEPDMAFFGMAVMFLLVEPPQIKWFKRIASKG